MTKRYKARQFKDPYLTKLVKQINNIDHSIRDCQLLINKLANDASHIVNMMVGTEKKKILKKLLKNNPKICYDIVEDAYMNTHIHQLLTTIYSMNDRMNSLTQQYIQLQGALRADLHLINQVETKKLLIKVYNDHKDKLNLEDLINTYLGPFTDTNTDVSITDVSTIDYFEEEIELQSLTEKTDDNSNPFLSNLLQIVTINNIEYYHDIGDSGSIYNKQDCQTVGTFYTKDKERIYVIN
uniref:Uncharacterized protein n=1 Tax=Megaviridae environmental sample TaxID=1737588 RepID=A0A5J6VH30_9VIRU|nr:MAG: hypothetical protein [Megaviridae environmental sample]